MKDLDPQRRNDRDATLRRITHRLRSAQLVSFFFTLRQNQGTRVSTGDQPSVFRMLRAVGSEACSRDAPKGNQSNVFALLAEFPKRPPYGLTDSRILIGEKVLANR